MTKITIFLNSALEYPLNSFYNRDELSNLRIVTLLSFDIDLISLVFLFHVS